MIEDTDEFDPPQEVGPRTPLVGTVLLAWMASGAAIGLSVGLTAQLTGVDAGLTSSIGLVCIALMSIAGVAALQVERSLARSRPAVLSRNGQHERPLHAGLYAIPLALALPAIGVLVVVGSVAMSSLLPALIFGTGGFVLGWGARRIVSSHALTAALEAIEVGDLAEARRRLQQIEAGWLATRSGRTSARLNLGMLALSQGDLDRAAAYYLTIEGGSGRAFAQAGLALVRVLQQRLEEAEHAVLQAMNSPGSHVVQGQLDTVRLLLLMRQEDDESARGLGDQLLNADAGELFLGLLALLRLRTDDWAGAQQLIDPHTRRALEESGWGQVIPEITELLAQPGLV